MNNKLIKQIWRQMMECLTYMLNFCRHFYSVCALLNVEKFYPDQEEALCNFFKGNDFFSAHTGYEKSLISQAIPVLIMADVLK